MSTPDPADLPTLDVHSIQVPIPDSEGENS